MVVLAAIIAIPIGIMVGIHLSEHPKTKFSNITRFLTDLIQGSPSIVIGIIAYAWVVKPLGSYSALAGSVALSIMMLPVNRAFHGRDVKDAPGKFERGRTCIRSLLHQCHSKSIVTRSLRGIVHGYLAGYLPGYGRNRTPDVNSLG